MKAVYLVVCAAIFSFLASGCGQKEEITVESIPIDPSSSMIFIVRSYANMLEEPITDPKKLPPVVIAVNQGDQVHVLESYQQWSKVMHHQSGKIGWLHNSFIQEEERNQWWSGDTEQARRIAQKIYKDKEWLKSDWPIKHVNIEERFSRMKLTIDSTVEFPRGTGQECVLHWIDILVEHFPRWRDHQVFLEAQDSDGAAYTLVVGADKKPTFL